MVQTANRPVSSSDWAICQEIAREHGRSFFLASRLLGAERRRSILAAYAYCRLADDIVDRNEGDANRVRCELQQWEAELDRPTHPVSIAFADARQRYAIPERPVRDLFEGMRADLTVRRYGTWSDLQEYCYQVAGTVGLIVAPILGCTDRAALPRAADLGIAMQLTNILRDVGEDAAMGRLYLPLDELAQFGIDPDRLMAGVPGPSFPAFMQYQIERARHLYARAETGVPSLCPSGRVTTLLASRLYAEILDRIVANEYDVFTRRAVVHRRRKARTTATTLAGFAGSIVVDVWDVRRSRSRSTAPPQIVDRDVEGWRP
jgi:phytoene synthase